MTPSKDIQSSSGEKAQGRLNPKPETLNPKRRFCHVPNGALEKFGPADEQKDGAEHDLRLCLSKDAKP